jgi:hypothetical protein
MARQIRSAHLENRTNRLALAVRKKPYTARIGFGIRLAYRRNQSGGVWSVLKSDGVGGSWLQRFALADDHEDANGTTILSYWEACDVARRIASGDAPGEPGDDPGKPLSVERAVDAFERDLIARDASPSNARYLRFHLKGAPAIRQKPVSLLTTKEMRAFRDGLLDKGLTRASVNRSRRNVSRSAILRPITRTDRAC